MYWFARHKPLGCAGLVVLLICGLAAACAPWISPFPFDETDFGARLQGPDGSHPFGTDNLGRDLLSRVLYAMRVSLAMAAGSMLIAQVLAIVIGVVTGYYGGWLDTAVQRLVDVWLAVPLLVVLVSLLGILGPSFWTALIAIGLLNAPSGARLIRGVVIGLRHDAYVEAARALGASDLRILLRHILPNTGHIVIFSATTLLGGAVLLSASLGFLGYGVPPPQPDLGAMLSGPGLQFMRRSPWMAIWPGLAITLIVFSFNVLGDALRDVLDPRLRGR